MGILPVGSKLLLTYRPQHTYLPLFEKARQEMAKTQLSTDNLRGQIRAAGYENISIHIEQYDTKIERETWLAMLRARHFSFLAGFTAEEVEQGIELELLPKYGKTEEISFKDSFVYLTVEGK